MTRLLVLVTALWLTLACSDKVPTPLALEKPSNFPSIPASPDRNPLTVEGVKLGRLLFYDPVLSKSGRISCSTCHQQNLAFTDGVPLGMMGDSRKPLARHSPSLVNLAWSREFFWDGGARDLESQVFQPLTHPDEMAINLDTMVMRLQSDPKYPELFLAAFEVDSITSAYIARALAQFQRTIISADSKYDRWIRGGDELTVLEQKGLGLFESKCASCHAAPLFTDGDYHNNGLDSTFSANNDGIHLGRLRISHKESDRGKFKTPSLRNVMLTAPYMHNGSLRDIYSVLDHYQMDMLQSATLDSIFMGKNRIGIEFNDGDKTAIVAFLHTLTDSTLATTAAYANPF